MRIIVVAIVVIAALPFGLQGDRALGFADRVRPALWIPQAEVQPLRLCPSWSLLRRRRRGVPRRSDGLPVPARGYPGKSFLTPVSHVTAPAAAGVLFDRRSLVPEGHPRL
jgi:hypothetical protein